MSKLKRKLSIMKKLIKTTLKNILLCLILLITNQVSAQDSLSYLNVYPEGISFEYGIGNYSLKDQYISKEKYSGMLPHYSFGCARKYNKYVYRLEIALRNANEIYKHNVSTDLYQFTLKQGFLYPIKKKTLFKNDITKIK